MSKTYNFKAKMNHNPYNTHGGGCMNVPLKGKAMQIVEEMVDSGYANTKSEAVRLAINTFGIEHFAEERLVRMKMDYMDRQAAQGKARLLTAEEAMGKYGKEIK